MREKRTQRRPRVILLRALLSWLLPPGLLLLPPLLLLLLLLLLLMEDVDTERWGSADVVVVPELSDKLSTKLLSRPDSWGRLVDTDTMASTAVVGGVF